MTAAKNIIFHLSGLFFTYRMQIYLTHRGTCTVVLCKNLKTKTLFTCYSVSSHTLNRIWICYKNDTKCSIYITCRFNREPRQQKKPGALHLLAVGELIADGWGVDSWSG